MSDHATTDGRLAEGKVVLVTGAASGMGRAGSVLFAAEGATHVYAVDRDGDGAEQTVELVRRARGITKQIAHQRAENAAMAIAPHDDALDVEGERRGIGDAAPAQRAPARMAGCIIVERPCLECLSGRLGDVVGTHDIRPVELEADESRGEIGALGRGMRHGAAVRTAA